MEDVYNLHLHTHCAVIYIGECEINVGVCSTSNRMFKKEEHTSKMDTCIIYDEQGKKVLSWGDPLFYDGNGLYIDDFMDGLYKVFKKDKGKRNEEDMLLIRAVSDFLQFKMKSLIGHPNILAKDLDAFHYMFVVPSDWDDDIKEELLRPIFIQSSLISKDDHEDRLLFFSDLESIFYYLQTRESVHHEEDLFEPLKVGNHCIICRVTPGKRKRVLIKLDLIEARHSLYNYDNLRVFPKVLRSTDMIITSDNIKNSILLFIRAKLVLSDDDTKHDNVIQKIAEDIYISVAPKMATYYEKLKENNDIGKMVEQITDTSKWELTKLQKNIIESISVPDLCADISKDILLSMKFLLTVSFRSYCRFISIDDQYSSDELYDTTLFAWIKTILDFCRHSLDYIIATREPDVNIKRAFAQYLIKGAAVNAFEAIQHSDIFTSPSILKEKYIKLSSTFINAKPNAIVNIDISFKSTSLSYLAVNNDGFIENIFANDYIMGHKSLPSLGTFYNVSDITELRVKESFILFTKKWLNNNLNNHIIDLKKKELLLEFELILNADYSVEKALVLIQEQKYLKFFTLMYLVYIQETILSGLSIYLDSNKKDKKIGYVISIEKILLDNVIGSKEDFKDLIFSSGIIRNDDVSKKLKIITPWEGLLPVIQKYWELKLPSLSRFILTQLHENYIQLTLNQVVKASSLEEGDIDEEKTIIIQDETIPIQNIYNSLCVNTWNHLIENNNLIRLCNVHKERDDYKSLKLFSLQGKMEFIEIFAEYISSNIISKNTNFQIDEKIIIPLNSTCTCATHLSIRDILVIAFKPVLQNIASIISASLLNTNVFGYYANIAHNFILIHFNRNPKFQTILSNLLSEEIDNFNDRQEIEIDCLIIPKLSDQIMQHNVKHKPYMSKCFEIGNLYQASNENYGFLIKQSISNAKPTSKNVFYKDKKTGDKSIACDGFGFLLFKRGDAINNIELDRIFHLKKQEANVEEFIRIELLKFKSLKKLEADGTISLKDNVYEVLDYFYVVVSPKTYQKDKYVPVMLSIRFKVYSSSFMLQVKEAGQDVRAIGSRSLEVGEPMTLSRY